ncbi:MAG: DUF4173 domain-containing protein [Anaerolineales bacterium]
MSQSDQADTSDLGGNWIQRPAAMAVIGLLLGIITKVLFHHHVPGLSYPLWSLACVIGLLAAARIESIKPAGQELILAVLILVFSAFFAVRREPLTVFLNMVFPLFLFGLWIRTFRWNRLADLNWLDYGLSMVLVPMEMLFRPWGVASRARRRLVSDHNARRPFMAVLRGLVLALPILVVFTALLASADLIFGDAVHELIDWLDWPLMVSWFESVLIIVVAGLVTLGAIVTALQPADDRQTVFEGRSLPRLLGLIESGVLLGAVDGLFMIFTLIQFRYLFGGEANINAAGYTYAEYARRGFGELVAVAFLSLGLIWLLSMVSRRDTRTAHRIFNGLSTLMVALLFVILASAFKRLLLYEQAYGFTNLRLYTHIAIVWMGLLFAGFLIILAKQRLGLFPLLTLAAAAGFTLTLNVINPEGLIVRQNLARAEISGELDLEYFGWLTSDSIPALVSGARNSDLEESDPLWAVLACHQFRLETRLENRGWPSFHVSDWLAQRSLAQVGTDLAGYELQDGWVTDEESMGELYFCPLR